MCCIKNSSNEKGLGEIIAYKQGGNWILNVDGYLETLHMTIQSKRAVRDAVKYDYPNRKLTFA